AERASVDRQDRDVQVDRRPVARDHKAAQDAIPPDARRAQARAGMTVDRRRTPESLAGQLDRRTRRPHQPPTRPPHSAPCPTEASGNSPIWAVPTTKPDAGA